MLFAYMKNTDVIFISVKKKQYDLLFGVEILGVLFKINNFLLFAVNKNLIKKIEHLISLFPLLLLFILFIFISRFILIISCRAFNFL